MKKVSIRASELSFPCAHEKTNVCFASVVHAAERWSLSVAAGKSTYLTVTTHPLSAGLCTALKCEVCPQAQARWDRARLSCRKPGEPDDLEEGALECHATRSSRRSAVAPRALDEGFALTEASASAEHAEIVAGLWVERRVLSSLALASEARAISDTQGKGRLYNTAMAA